MGDYTKLIVNCEVEVDEEKLRQEIEELRLGVSAYHCGGIVESISRDGSFNSKSIALTLVGQTKYGRGQNEFLEWLKPHVIQGNGPSEIFAIQINEYSVKPTIWELDPTYDPNG